MCIITVTLTKFKELLQPATVCRPHGSNEEEDGANKKQCKSIQKTGPRHRAVKGKKCPWGKTTSAGPSAENRIGHGPMLDERLLHLGNTGRHNEQGKGGGGGNIAGKQ
jgi:hypothetical protein